MYRIVKYTGANNERGTTKLVTLKEVATNKQINVGISFTNNHGYTTRFDIYDELNDLPPGTIIDGVLKSTGHGYPTFKRGTILIVSAPSDGKDATPDCVDEDLDAPIAKPVDATPIIKPEEAIANSSKEPIAKPKEPINKPEEELPLVARSAEITEPDIITHRVQTHEAFTVYTPATRLTERELVNYVTLITAYAGNTVWKREAPLELPDTQCKFIDLLSLHCQRVNAYEFKAHEITADEMNDKLAKCKYPDRLMHSYRRKVMTLTFTSPEGITSDALVALRGYKSAVKLSWVPTNMLLANLIKDSLEAHTEENRWFIAKELLPIVNDCPIDNKLALAVLYNYLNVATLLTL